MEIELFGLKISLIKIINPVFYMVFILILYLIVRRILKTIFKKAQQGKHMTEQQKHRVQTVHEMLKSVIKYLALILVFLAILADFGVNITSLVAGLGVLTAILGLALQDMIKDMIAGIAIITEGQFSVGDTVEVNGFKGVVLSLGLKTTQIQNYRGEVKIISNRNMDSLVNYSKFDCQAEVEVKVPYEVDPDKVTEALVRVQKLMNKKMDEMAGEVVLSPLADWDEVGVIYKLSCPCRPEAASDVQTAIRKALLKELKEERIEIAYPQMVVKGK